MADVDGVLGFESRSEFNLSGRCVRNEIPSYDDFDLPGRNHRFSTDKTHTHTQIYIYIYLCVNAFVTSNNLFYDGNFIFPILTGNLFRRSF